jgi:hypothetical protein
MIKRKHVFLLCVSFYHESGCVSHFVSHHKSGRVSFYHKSGRISHSVYRETGIRMARLCFISSLKSALPARTEQWQRPILSCSYYFFSFLDTLSKNLLMMKHNSYMGLSSPLPTHVFLPFIPRSNDLGYHWNIISLM